ncbi:MAG TPA: polysaccharide deacetylase [Bradyrhizobium sp.]|nr:polysaccharide deacetylase [Bradyrhizobium sp.]
MTEREYGPKNNGKPFGFAINMVLALVCLLISAGPAVSENTGDWITGLPREPIHVAAWPGGRKIAVCFIFYVEIWGFGHGPNFRSDMVARDPDVVDEAFRQYAVDWGIPRVGRLFDEQGMPLSIALNALFPETRPDLWKQFRSLVPKAPIIAHGINNSTDLLPLGRGLDEQRAYIHRTLDLIEKYTGVRSRGWTSPSVYPNGDTFRATAAEGIAYSLDGMDSDILSRLTTQSGPLVLIPYPAVTVDMGQYLQRLKQPADMERLWIDYVTELAREAEAHPDREATVVAIGIHPFVVGTPDGAAALRRVLENFKNQKLVWVTDVEAVLGVAGEQR